MTEEKEKPELTPIQLSLYTIKLVEAMKTGKPGDVLTDEQLQEACGRNCAPKGEGYGNLQSAIRKCRREHRVVWRRIREGGAIKCLKAGEIVSGSEADRRYIERAAKRSCDKLACADATSLDDDGRKKLTMNMAQMGSLALLSSTKATRKLEARGVQAPISEKQLLEVFK